MTLDPHDKRLLLVIAFYSFIAIGVAPGVLNIAWESIESTFNLPFSALGVLLGAATAGRLLFAFISGSIINRFGIGLFLLTGSVLVGVGELGFAFAPSFALILMTAVVASMGAGILDAGMNTFVSAYYGKGAMNWLHAFFGVGLTAGPLIFSTVVDDLELSWRAVYVVVFAFQVILAVVLLFTLKKWKTPPIQEEADELVGRVTKPASITESLGTTAVFLGLLMFMIYGGVEIGAGQLANTLFTEGRNVSTEQSSLWVSIYWGSFTIGRMIAGSIGDAISNNRLMRLSIFISLFGAFLFWLNITNLVGFLGLAILGFGLAPMFATLIAETPRRVGRRHTANAIGFQVGIAGVGGALLPGLAGVMADTFGLEVISLFLFVNMIAVWLLHEYILLREAREVVASHAGD